MITKNRGTVNAGRGVDTVLDCCDTLLLGNGVQRIWLV